MKILLTGFEAFGGMQVNPSQVIVESISNIDFKTNFDLEIITSILPVDFALAGKELMREISLYQPDYCISTGVDLGKPHIELEQIAHKKAIHFDKELKKQIASYGFSLAELPDQLSSKIDLVQVLARISSSSVPAKVSFHTGGYVCNHIHYLGNMYSIYLNSSMKSFFVHLPYPYPYTFDEEYIDPDFTISDIQQVFLELLTTIIELHLDATV
ncbi:pyroglutamyl-peptidase I family protein [Flavilitoribacter nigricans]|uniref:Pyrrolidone-carboxylate peptidase n=1 Tax=Flavilitoribacter nigricans (strain ATCC 23147 / DSM 23189 / NBRC 102662 / NCIMB 1420 / SS-2) TaxID=1122177 RepID=A0A2D0MWE8_FLAN2|nr:hypothetical protein [Flavilitoribacter nigricans]PHN00591.1 hypothetical protein CRP01_41415 [Flavilitoribacter nigricans DSM 23189 = NBRC 102662]